MMRKKESYSTITPLPGYIPRQLAIDILHSHSEVITLNPLVIDVCCPRALYYRTRLCQESWESVSRVVHVRVTASTPKTDS
jgi:hypothetical protein